MTLYALSTWFPEDFTGMLGVLRAERPGWSFQNLERIWRAMTAVEHDGRGIFPTGSKDGRQKAEHSANIYIYIFI